MPFNMDMAIQIAQTQGFEGLVDSAAANNQQMQFIADSALAANQGQMSASFQTWMADVHQTAMTNNTILSQIKDALHFSIGSTSATEADNASPFQALTGAIGSPFASGAHFGG
jgi:uncharacterized protein YukE